MAHIIGNMPYLKCLVRKEFTTNFKSGRGEYIEAIAHAIRSVRGNSLWFQCALGEPYGGVHFMVPIDAIVWRSCELPVDKTYIQPWDCFSSDFGVCQFDFTKFGEAEVLPARVKGQYHCTIDFIGTDLSEDMEQHKHLHIVKMESGLIGAFPNNRVIFPDPAFWQTIDQEAEIKFDSLGGEYRSEGNQSLFNVANAS
jgi:hypothetical protein